MKSQYSENSADLVLVKLLLLAFGVDSNCANCLLHFKPLSISGPLSSKCQEDTPGQTKMS